ncbi:TPA: acyltransferase [Escherichia coli]|nr:acyltransferase [Escherichia coli]
MNYVIVFLYLYCLYLSAKKRGIQLFVCILFFSLFMSYFVFNDNIMGCTKGKCVGIFPVFLVYCSIYFYMYLLFIPYGLLGAFAHAMVVSLIPLLGILIPLNPIILLYGENILPLPSLDISILNLFILNLITSVCFSFKTPRRIRCIVLLLGILFSNNTAHRTPQKKLNVVVVQVGLYFESVGFHDNLFFDLIGFIKNKDVDIIVFSENTFFGYKNQHIKKKTIQLMESINNNRVNAKYGVLLNFYGYDNINNVISYFWHKNNIHTHQKSKLIPFFEKRNIFNSFEGLDSPFLFYDKNVNDSKYFNYNGNIITSHICYEGLFPNAETEVQDLSIIQSDYSRLNMGDRYDNLIINGTLLSKFSVAPNGPLINIQNYGGTIFIDKNWNIDMDIFEKSKVEPFVLISI